MDAGHGDVEVALVHGHIPGGTQGRPSRGLARRHHSRLLAGAGDREHAAVFEIDPAQGVVLVVGDEDVVADDLNALGLVELRFGGRAVREARFRAADHL